MKTIRYFLIGFIAFLSYSYSFAQTVTKEYSNGDKYVGEWKDGKINGQGTYTWTDGGKYVGEWKDDKRNGQGTYTLADGGKYVGEFKDDKINGQGTFTLADGGKYVGEFKDDKINGQGTFTYASGDKYVGEWKDDKLNGYGCYNFADGKTYVGYCRDDKWDGQGTFTYVMAINMSENIRIARDITENTCRQMEMFWDITKTVHLRKLYNKQKKHVGIVIPLQIPQIPMQVQLNHQLLPTTIILT